MDAIVKFILPITFVAYKLTGSFIDFMLALTTSQDGTTNNVPLFDEFSYSNLTQVGQMADQIGSYSIDKMKRIYCIHVPMHELKNEKKSPVIIFDRLATSNGARLFALSPSTITNKELLLSHNPWL